MCNLQLKHGISNAIMNRISNSESDVDGAYSRSAFSESNFSRFGPFFKTLFPECYLFLNFTRKTPSFSKVFHCQSYWWGDTNFAVQSKLSDTSLAVNAHCLVDTVSYLRRFLVHSFLKLAVTESERSLFSVTEDGLLRINT